jgi:hypothetical protein
MNKKPKHYWKEFKDNFKKQIASQDFTQLEDAWKTQGKRTEWYKQNVLPCVAIEMGFCKVAAKMK